MLTKNKKGLLFLLIALIIVPTIFAALPYPGKCHQRGFEQNKTHCFLPNGSSCTLENFEAGTCGQEYQDFCIKEGESAWKNQGYECCGNMEPYLRPGHVGQTSCQPLSVRIEENLKYNPFWWLVGAIILIFIIIMMIRVKKKKN